MLNALKKKQIHRWGVDYLRHLRERSRATRRGPTHVLFAFCDHWEPLWGDATDSEGDARVARWHDDYPKAFGSFRDADGVAPQHSFFFPGEQYRPRWIDALADLSRQRFGEVELHLHHDGDTRASLKRDIERYVRELASHGHLSRDADGRLRYGFIHGNWCLANSAADQRMCGVDDEIPLLFETGCYADFTFPAPESAAQPPIVNQIYWPIGDLHQRRAHDHGERARVGAQYSDRILLIEGPTAMSLVKRKMPLKIELGDVNAHDPPTPARVDAWVNAGVSVEGRPDWVFVKLHTHGAPDDEALTLLGEPVVAMHRYLNERYNDGRDFILHYVTAREMFNLARAAMDGASGDPHPFRDHVLSPPPVRN
jgi:hypothetical protein